MDEATRVYRDDLAAGRGNSHPGNIWALAGLSRCLRSTIAAMSATEGTCGKKLLLAELAELAVKLALVKLDSDFEVKFSCSCVGLRKDDKSNATAILVNK